MSLPFWMIPAHWGLKGRARGLAEIDHYVYDEYAAAILRAQLNDDPIETLRSELNIKRKFNKITQVDYQIEMIKLIEPLISELDYKKKVLQIRKENNDIGEREAIESEIELLPDGDEKELLALEV